MTRSHRSYDLPSGGQGDEPPSSMPAGFPSMPAAAAPSSSSTSSETGKKPCRTCTDFRTWMAVSGKKREAAAGAAGAAAVELSEERAHYVERDIRGCPLDKDELGRATWKLLHTITVNYPEKPTQVRRSRISTRFSVFLNVCLCSSPSSKR